ncbi:MAG TPA: choice-of-anchor D domain-containing protein [Actinocrinis sp.]
MFHQIIRAPSLRRVVALAGSSALLAAGAVVALSAAPAQAATATGGGGASLPYVEVQAENEPTTGTVIGPSYTQGQLADEAAGRKAVTLSGSGSGQSVTFTSPIATNSIDFRYSIPDSSDGSVYTAPISLYVNGTKQSDFTLTNAYSWYYGSYPFTNTPSSGNPHHFYDEVHRLFGTTYQAGTTFKLEVDSEDTAGSYTIDEADFENVGAALTQPSGSVSVTGEGADPTGAADSTNAFNAAISAAGSGGTVWIPPGTYDIPGHIIVNNVTLAGAGMWYSAITGTAPGIYGNSAPSPSTNVHLENFAIFGNVQERDDSAQVNGIGGAMSNSTVSDIWIEHDKVGAWMDGPMSNLTFSGMRIRDTTADGINLHGGVTGSTITNSDIRNTGDDGIALWADSSIGADAQDTISDNTVQLQQLANGIAVYGGNNNTVNGNLVVDTGITQGGGITVAQRFTSTTVGPTTVENNTMIRDGSLDPNWQFGVGALWFDGSQGNFTGPVNVSNELIEQSPFEAVQWVEGTISNVNLSNISIVGTGTFALQEQTGGTASFTNVTATGVAQANEGNAPSYNCEGTNFAVTDGGGNSGISPANCNVGDAPAPVYPPYPASSVTVTPGALNFGSLATGQTSAAQTVTVANPTNAAASVSGISVSGQFAQTNTCGSSIAANGSCTVGVTFKPTSSGAQSGALTVNAGGVTDTVTLSGTGTAPGPVLSLNPGSLSFASSLVGTADPTQTVTVSNTGTSAATVSGVSAGGDFSETNNCSSLAVNATCTVTVGFTPTAAGTRTGTLTITSNANNSPTTAALSGTGIGSTTNLALAGTMTSSSTASGFPATNANDGNTSTYWESLDGAAYPQTLTANLGKSYPLGSVTLTLPPSTAWSTRTETLSVLGSTNGSSYTTLVPSANYTFNPSSGNNTVSFNLPSGTNDQYLQLSFTANTGWSAAQISEFEIFPGSGGNGTSNATLSASPTSLSFGSETVNSPSAAKPVTVTNTGNAAAAISSITAPTGYSQTNTCGSSLAAGASCTVSVVFDPAATGTYNGNLVVSSNASNSPLNIGLSGTGASSSGTPHNLSQNTSVSASSYTQTYAPANAVDGNTSTYWESVNGSWPATFTDNLGASHTLSSVVIDLPPATAWSTRTQTLSVLVSSNGSSYTTVVGSSTYTWNPSTGNTVTITLPSGTTAQYVQLSFTANSVQNGAQMSELEVMGI